MCYIRFCTFRYTLMDSKKKRTEASITSVKSTIMAVSQICRWGY